MNEETNVSVEQDAQAIAQAVESEVTQEATGTDDVAAKKRSDAEYNWAELRKAREEDRRRLQELDRQKRELEEKVNTLLKKETPDEEDDGIRDDDIAEGKHVKQLKKQLRQLESYIKQKEVSSVDERLSLKFPDFAETVTRENIELLKQTEPELAVSLSHNPDPYAQGIAAYKLLKKLGIGVPDPLATEKEKAKANSQKPISVNAVTKQNSALGNAHLFENGLTKELKSQLWKEMQDCAKRTA